MRKSAKQIIVQVDGASRGNPGPSGIGAVIKDAKGRVLQEISEFIGRATNNVAEYRALLKGITAARALGAGRLEIQSDSDLLVNQLTGTYKVKSLDLAPLHEEALRQLGTFSEWSAHHVPRGENAAADALANQALDHAQSNSELEFSVILGQEGRVFVARVPAFPGVEGRGTSKSAALEHARSGVFEAVQELRRQGRSIPREERIRIRVAPELR